MKILYSIRCQVLAITDKMFRWLDLYFNDLQSGIPTGLYFLVFLVSLTNVIYVSPLWNTKVRRRSSTNILSISILLNILAIIAFAITWSLILDFFEQEADAMRDLPYEEFLNARSTFVRAYEEVTTTTGYFYSQQLLMWVIPGCIFLQNSRMKKQITLAYTATGFLGAISLSFPLFFSHLLLLDVEEKEEKNEDQSSIKTAKTASLLQIVCAVIAVIAVVVLPQTVHTHPQTYVIALFLLHIVLAIPALCSLFITSEVQVLLPTTTTISLHDLYFGLTGASFVVHLTHLITAVKESSTISDLIHFGWQNTCQSSISYDVVFTILICGLYVGARRGFGSGCLVVILSPFVSIGSTFSFFLAMEESNNNVVVNKINKSNKLKEQKKNKKRTKSKRR